METPAFPPGTTDDSIYSTPSGATPWLTIKEGAARARCGPRQLYAAVHQGTLRAVRVGGRGELRFRQEWVDEWLERAPALGRHTR